MTQFSCVYEYVSQWRPSSAVLENSAEHEQRTYGDRELVEPVGAYEAVRHIHTLAHINQHVHKVWNSAELSSALTLPPFSLI